MEQTIWSHLSVLLTDTKDCIERILQILWSTRFNGLDSTQRCFIQNKLKLQSDSDLDPLLVCLRTLIRRCVYDNTSKDDIPKLFPAEVDPKLIKLLSILLHKFQPQWQDDLLQEQNIVPRLKAMTWCMANVDEESAGPAVVINLKLQSDAQSHAGQMDVKFQLASDSLEMMLKAMHCMRNHFYTVGELPNE